MAIFEFDSKRMSITARDNTLLWNKPQHEHKRWINKTGVCMEYIYIFTVSRIRVNQDGFLSGLTNEWTCHHHYWRVHSFRAEQRPGPKAVCYYHNHWSPCSSIPSSSSSHLVAKFSSIWPTPNERGISLEFVLYRIWVCCRFSPQFVTTLLCSSVGLKGTLLGHRKDAFGVDKTSRNICVCAQCVDGDDVRVLPFDGIQQLFNWCEAVNCQSGRVSGISWKYSRRLYKQ